MRIKPLYFLVLGIGLLLTVLNACKKDEPDDEGGKDKNSNACPTCIYATEAQVALDSSSAGVYKAILIGSSGTIRFYLHNGNAVDTGLIVFDGHLGSLTTQSLTNWSPGQAIDSALFTGTVNGQPVEVYFSVDAKGYNPQVWCNIPGHTVVATMVKERRYCVQGYEGRYFSTIENIEVAGESGPFNILRSTARVTLLLSQNGYIGQTLLSPIDFETLQYNGTVKTLYRGRVSGDTILSGSWKAAGGGGNGGWKVWRTM